MSKYGPLTFILSSATEDSDPHCWICACEHSILNIFTPMYMTLSWIYYIYYSRLFMYILYIYKFMYGKNPYI